MLPWLLQQSFRIRLLWTPSATCNMSHRALCLSIICCLVTLSTSVISSPYTPDHSFLLAVIFPRKCYIYRDKSLSYGFGKTGTWVTETAMSLRCQRLSGYEQELKNSGWSSMIGQKSNLCITTVPLNWHKKNAFYRLWYFMILWTNMKW